MWKLSTERGAYSVKFLNFKVMARVNAIKIFKEAERLKNIVGKSIVPIISTLIFIKEKMQKLTV